MQNTQCLHPTITRGTLLPPPVGYLSLQSWLSNRAVAFSLHSKTTSSSHAPTNRISVREGVFKPSNDVFDTDSFLIGVDSFASVTMATRPKKFEDLILDAGQSVQGIEGGLAIKGHGTFIFNIEDDEGTVHHIKIPDSMYVPDLKCCLLSPQHWAQKAHNSARGKRMEIDADGVILIWGHGNYRHTIPHSCNMNTPVCRTALTKSTYRAFSAHIEAMEATFHRQEHVIQFPGRHCLMHDEDEFLADENILLRDDYKKTNF